MPIIQFDGPALSKEKKAELAAKLTLASKEVLGLPEEAFLVVMRENSLDNIASGGVLLSEKHK